MRVLQRILEILYPRVCAGCGHVLTDEEVEVCDVCLRALRLTEQAANRGNRMEQLFRAGYLYSKDLPLADKLEKGAAYAFFVADTPIRNIVHQMKFGGRPQVAKEMGRLAAQQMLKSDFFRDVDYLVPMPLHETRLAERGFNQSEWLARGISEVTGIALMTDVLVRTKATEQQSLKTLEERKAMGEVFASVDGGRLRGKHVMLIDDIVTSGTTMTRALTPLHAIPGCRYSVMALALAGG